MLEIFKSIFKSKLGNLGDDIADDGLATGRGFLRLFKTAVGQFGHVHVERKLVGLQTVLINVPGRQITTDNRFLIILRNVLHDAFDSASLSPPWRTRLEEWRAGRSGCSVSL